jgi:hypothetical protein
MEYLRKLTSKINTRIALAVLSGAVLGAVLLIGIRFIFNQPQNTHYHANFAVFINGERETFTGPGYYEEVQACSATESPRGRTHMHQPDNNVVHVHDTNVTWGHFFESIGWALGPEALVTNNGVFQNTQATPLAFYINNKEVVNPFREVIQNESTLVVSFGDNNPSVEAMTHEAQKPTPAQTANIQKDPAACRGEQELSLTARLKNALW